MDLEVCKMTKEELDELFSPKGPRRNLANEDHILVLAREILENRKLDEGKIYIMDAKFIRSTEFETLKRITVLSVDRVDAASVGAKFKDQWGMTCRVKFKFHGEEVEHILESTAYSFYLDWKNSKVKSGDDCFLLCVPLVDPENPEKIYRKWVIQPLRRNVRQKQVDSTESESEFPE